MTIFEDRSLIYLACVTRLETQMHDNVLSTVITYKQYKFTLKYSKHVYIQTCTCEMTIQKIKMHVLNYFYIEDRIDKY